MTSPKTENVINIYSSWRPWHTLDLTSWLMMICKLSIRARMFLFSLLFRLMSFLSDDVDKISPLYIFAYFIRLFVTKFDDYMVPRWTVQRSNIFFGFIINSIVSINLENPQKLSKLIILSRIVHVIHQFKSGATYPTSAE